jgi:phosphatidylinositol alpha-mannosyltransferase
MKIALVSPYDWSFPGGVRTHIEHLSAELRKRGHTVRIITASSNARHHAAEYGVYRVGWAAPFRMNGSVARIAITSDITGSLRRLLRREQFDLVHLHEPLVSPLTLAMLRLSNHMGIACVGTFHASSNRRASTAGVAYAMASPFLQVAFRRLDGLIAVSEAARDHVGRLFPGNFHIIPNGIVIPTTAAAPDPRFADGMRNVVFLGRLEPRKGLRYLLKAIPRVRASFDGPVRFIIVGDGPQRVRFERFVQRQGWPEVVFTGYASDAEICAIFAAADIYCAPSIGNESQGIVLLEAMSAGVPVVASDIPGYRTVIASPEMGTLVPPRDPERLAWALCHLLRDDDLRRRKAAAGQRRALDYSWERVANAVEHVYQQSLEHHRERSQHAHLRLPMSMRRPEALAGVAESSLWREISPFEENVVE